MPLRLCCVLVVTLLLVTAPALGGTGGPAAGIDAVAYAGNGSVDVPGPGPVLWEAGSHEFAVTVSSPSGVDAEVCLVANATGRELGCARESVPANGTERVAVGVGRWPDDATGTVALDVVVREAGASTPLDRQSLDVTVLHRDGDTDVDGLTSGREVSIGTDPRLPDTDGDGIADGSEVFTYGSSPAFADSDNDGLPDGAEIERYGTDLLNPDTDGDGLSDARELEVGASPFSQDSDGDGLDDAVEVNTYGTNATAADTDGDGLDDGTELDTHRTNPMTVDTDGDGLSDALEVFTHGTAPGDLDTDDDGLTDGAEVSDYRTEPTTADTDGDGLDDGAEVNAHGTNPLAVDADGDGLDDGAEVNAHGTNPLAVDTDDDGTNDRLEVRTGLFPDLGGLELVGGGLVVALVAAAAGYRWAGRRGPERPAASTDGGGRTAAERPDPDAETADASADEPTPSEVAGPPTALSNEERVLRLLDEHDGRMRQSEVVAGTDWSKAKVSRVLSTMEGEGTVTKIDVGRENVIARPGEAPSGADPPFER
ncbi:MAG: helix-turn-helix domain-containing protein [Haloferacaceae archaeon]